MKQSHILTNILKRFDYIIVSANCLNALLLLNGPLRDAFEIKINSAVM